MPLRWSYGWNIVACAVAYQALCVGMLLSGTAVLVVPWASEFEASRGEVLLIPLFWQIGFSLGAPFLGRLFDRVSMRRLVLLGLALFAAGLLLASRAHSIFELIVVYGSLLCAGSLLAGTVSAQALVAKWFLKRRGLAFGVAALGVSLGGALVPPVLTFLIAHYGWRGSMLWIAAATVLVMMPIAALVLAVEPPKEEAKSTADLSRAGNQSAQSTSPPIPILRSRVFWIPSLCIAVLGMCSVGLQLNLLAHALDLQFSSAQAAYLLSVSAIAAGAGKLLTGFLADHMDDRKIYWSAATILVVAMIFLLASSSYAALMAAALFSGLASGSILPLLSTTLVARFGAANFGKAIGLAQLPMSLAALGPQIAGRVYDQTGSYSGAFGTFVVAIIFAMLLMLTAGPTGSNRSAIRPATV